MSKMSEKAILNDEQLGLPRPRIKEIYLDHDFNCRGFFSEAECLELAKQIARDGLQQPITVRRLRHSETELLDKGYKYVVIAGHRRLTSYRINEADRIPAIIKPETISDFEAHNLNAIENLQRKDLNIWQEAQAIRHLWAKCYTLQEAAEEITKSVYWVQQRYFLLDAPPRVQEIASEGLLKSSDITALMEHKEDEEYVLKLAGMIRDKREKGQNRSILSSIPTKKDLTSKKVRKKKEILEMLLLIQNNFSNLDEWEIPSRTLFSAQGNGPITRVLAWAAGEISTEDLYQTFEDFADANVITFYRPHADY